MSTSAYWPFGLAAISTSLGQIILPLRVLDVAPEVVEKHLSGSAYVIGMGVAMLVQPAVGYLSDKTTWRWGRRRPYIAVGALVATGLMVGVGGGSELREPAGDVGAGAAIR